MEEIGFVRHFLGLLRCSGRRFGPGITTSSLCWCCQQSQPVIRLVPVSFVRWVSPHQGDLGCPAASHRSAQSLVSWGSWSDSLSYTSVPKLDVPTASQARVMRSPPPHTLTRAEGWGQVPPGLPSPERAHNATGSACPTSPIPSPHSGQWL